MKTSLNNILLPYCSWLLTILFSINAEQQQQLTTRNNMGNKILFRPVFNNIVTGWAFLVVRWLFLWKTSLIYRFMSGILTQTKSETRIHIPSSFRTNYFGKTRRELRSQRWQKNKDGIDSLFCLSQGNLDFGTVFINSETLVVRREDKMRKIKNCQVRLCLLWSLSVAQTLYCQYNDMMTVSQNSDLQTNIRLLPEQEVQFRSQTNKKDI
jgi:hypothetical protein